MARFTTAGGSGDGTPGAPGSNGSDGKDSLFLGTWNSVTAFLAIYQGGPVGLADGDWWAFVKDNTDPNKIYVVREDPNSATGWVIDDNESFTLPAGEDGADGSSTLLKGSFNYFGDLDVTITNANIGDTYLVLLASAESLAGNLWTWNGTGWTNAGQILGPQGAPGADGADGAPGADGADGAPGADGADGVPGADFGIYYLGNYNPSSGYVPNIAVVRGSDGQLYLAKASGQLGDPVGNTAQWEVWIPKGQDGAPGTNGADALWNYVGEYSGGASYAVGDVVTFDGQLWYRYNANGGNVGDTPSPGLWNLLAAKGADSTSLNFWDFTGDPGVPTTDGAIVTDGLSARSGGNVTIHATTGGKIVLAGSGGEFLFDSNVPANQIATIEDVEGQLNYWDGIDPPQDPAKDGFLIVDGIVTGLGSNLLVSASAGVFIGGNDGEFLNGSSAPENQIATLGDLPTGATGTFTSQDNKTITVTNGIITSIV